MGQLTGGLFLVCIFVAALIGGFVGGCIATMFHGEPTRRPAPRTFLDEWNEFRDEVKK